MKEKNEWRNRKVNDRQCGHRGKAVSWFHLETAGLKKTPVL